MDTTTFCQSYIGLAHKMLAISQKPEGIESERKWLKQESEEYVDYLEKFAPFFEVYPALRTELITNLANFKVGAFIEYQLDLFYMELRKIEDQRTNIQREITGLRNNFANESKEWLPGEENKIADCYRYLDTANIQQVAGFLNDRLVKLRAKKETLSKKPYIPEVSVRVEKPLTEEEIRLQAINKARGQGISMTPSAMEERQKKMQEISEKAQNWKK